MITVLQSQNQLPEQAWTDRLATLNQLRAAEFDRAYRALAAGVPAEQVLEQFARRLTAKFLHAPTHALNRARGAERAGFEALE